jgi:SAM-dependent methyltransferase
MSLAENYETYLVPIIMDHWAQNLVSLVRPGDRMLDVGCGTGIVTRRAAEIIGAQGTIVGLDISPDMLAVARSASIPEGVNVNWVEGDAADMTFEDEHFDVVLCQFAFMFMEDTAAALREMRRVLAPGGTLGLRVFAPGPYDRALREVLGRHAAPDENDFAIWAWGFPDKLRQLIEPAGFEITRLEREDIPSCYASVRQAIELMRDWSRTVAELAPDVFERVCSEMETKMHSHVTDRGFKCPEPVITVIARAG